MPIGNFQTVGVIGLGLIGGSMAKAAQKAGFTVLGTDRDPSTMTDALQQGAVKEPLTKENISRCDLLLIALYPMAAVETLTALAPFLSKDCLAVDLCGVKRVVCAPLSALARQYGFSYLGGHPMAGMEKSGFSVSRADLFQGASMILTPEEDFDPDLFEKACLFFRQLGFGRVQPSNPEEHDRIIALTSQLAHVISCAYMDSPTALEFSGFSAGSFQDMTRVAKLNETMWTELFCENRDFLAWEIEGMAQRLSEYGRAVKEGNKEQLFALLAASRRRKEQADAQKAATEKRGEAQ